MKEHEEELEEIQKLIGGKKGSKKRGAVWVVLNYYYNRMFIVNNYLLNVNVSLLKSRIKCKEGNKGN